LEGPNNSSELINSNGLSVSINWLKQQLIYKVFQEILMRHFMF